MDRVVLGSKWIPSIMSEFGSTTLLLNFDGIKLVWFALVRSRMKKHRNKGNNEE